MKKGLTWIMFPMMILVVSVAVAFLNALPFSDTEKAILVAFTFILIGVMFYFALE